MYWNPQDSVAQTVLTVADLRELLLQLLDDPEMAEAVHKRSDKDNGVNAQHHTLGVGKHQSKAGNL